MPDVQKKVDQSPSPLPLTAQDVERLLHLNSKIVTRVVVEGLKNTRKSIVQRELTKLEHSRTMRDIIMNCEAAKERWLTMGGVFKDVNCLLEHGEKKSKSNSEKEEVTIRVQFDEAKSTKSFGVFTTEMAAPEFKLEMTNVFGGAYSFVANFIPSALHSQSWSLAAVSNAPLIGDRCEYNVGARKEALTYHPADFARIEEAKIELAKGNSALMHKLTLGLQRREFTASGESASLPEFLTQDFPKSQKTFVKHELNLSAGGYHAHPELFSMYPLPIAGSEVNWVNEFATKFLGGETSFWRSEMQFTKAWLLHPFASLAVSARIGAVCPLFGDSRVRLNDRLFLNWRHVRGYKGIGPSNFEERSSKEELQDSFALCTKYAATGGTALWALSTSLNMPLPFFPKNGFFAFHLFANIGNVSNIFSASVLKCKLGSLFTDADASVGAGLIATRIPLLGILPNGRFELNFSVPLSIRNGSLACKAQHPTLFDRVKFGLVWCSQYPM